MYEFYTYSFGGDHIQMRAVHKESKFAVSLEAIGFGLDHNIWKYNNYTKEHCRTYHGVINNTLQALLIDLGGKDVHFGS